MKIQYNFRVDENIIEKIKYIAETEERTTSQQITLYLKQKIIEYETENGEIEV